MNVIEPGLRTIADTAPRIARREVSPVTLVEEALARIERLEPRLNAFITVLADDAARQAEQAAAEIAAGHYRGPLHGVPVSLKDLFLTRGIRTTAGSRLLANYLPDRDATVVARLRDAGAIVIGKNNMLEFAYGEVSPDYGPSRNPWHTAYSASGSSSGSAVAVAAGLGFASLGSDTGGSIRLPAAYCGIVGLKPTYGLVSRAGVLPLSWSLDHVGPLTRTVRDCALVLEAIAGHDPADPTSAPGKPPPYSAGLGELPRGLTAGVVEPHDDDRVTPEVRDQLEVAAEHLRDLGFNVRPVALPYAKEATRTLLAILYPEASSYHAPWLRDRATEYSDNTRERLELGALLPATSYLRARRARRVIVAAYRELFEKIDVLLTPPGPTAANRLDAPPEAPVDVGGDRMGPLIRFSGPFDLTGYPALALPAGQNADGLPLAVQLVTPPFTEELLLQVARALEQSMAAGGGTYR